MYSQLVEFFTEDYLFMKYQDKDIIASLIFLERKNTFSLFICELEIVLNQPVFRFIMLKCIVQMSL